MGPMPKSSTAALPDGQSRRNGRRFGKTTDRAKNSWTDSAPNQWLSRHPAAITPAPQAPNHPQLPSGDRVILSRKENSLPFTMASNGLPPTRKRRGARHKCNTSAKSHSSELRSYRRSGQCPQLSADRSSILTSNTLKPTATEPFSGSAVASTYERSKQGRAARARRIS